jgi:AcrR family transcriptional regulator
MVQRKKPEVRDAILKEAYRLFSTRGYAETTLAEVAKAAEVSSGNVYIYFGSKLEILYTIYEPWLRSRIETLEQELAQIKSPRKRLKRLLTTLWRDVPAEENGFLNNIIQAVSASNPAEGYRSELIEWLEQRVGAIVMGALPPERRTRLRKARIAHLCILAFDGFAIYRHLHPDEQSIDDEAINAFVSILLGE